MALSDSGVVLPILPRPGGAGRQPTVADLDGAGSAQVLAGTGDDSLLFVYDLGPTSGRPSPWPTPHGNFARTGNRLYAPPVRAPDTVPPAAVADLAADSVAVHGASLIWTAPGDDGNAGRAAAYDLRKAAVAVDASGNAVTCDNIVEGPAGPLDKALCATALKQLHFEPALDENGKLIGTGEYERMDVQMVLRSVGYQSVPLAGVPFDKRTSTVPNEAGRVTGPDGAPLPREYVVGWLKRGPTGVIGTNKSDAADTVRSLLADCAPGQAPDGLNGAAREQLAGVLAARGVLPVTYADWLRVEQAETDLAVALGRGSRVKLASREAIDAACRPPRG